MDERMKRAAGYAPIAMSLVALAIVLYGIAKYGAHPPQDEGWEAHVFQILMVAQIPIIVLYIAAAGSQSFVRILPVLGLQALAWLAACGALYIAGF
ncbi:MAG: hypothetical protein GZ088_02320 [Acidipila sp.]|nr:hypothetical protein [Acidipila sp.]